MGSRANVAVRQDGAWVHCGSNGMGYSLDAWLAAGPDAALAVVRSFPVWSRDEWQWESSCEAGALIDLDARELLVFLSLDYDRRLALLDGYRRTWPGWRIRWAYNGLREVTDALGLPRAVLRPDPWDDTDLFRWGRPGPGEEPSLRYLVTVGDVAYGLNDSAVPPWQLGPDLLDQLTTLPRPATWPVVPQGGLHLDPRDRTAGIWSVTPVHGVTDRFAARWPGWTLEFWDDRYAEQERRCGGAFRFADPALSLPECRKKAVQRLLDHWIYATPELRAEWPDIRHDYGTRSAGLSVADLQRLGELLAGPDAAPRPPLDVAAYARDLAGS